MVKMVEMGGNALLSFVGKAMGIDGKNVHRHHL